MKNPLKLWLYSWHYARLERRHYCKSWLVGEVGVASFMAGYREVPRRLMVQGPATAQIVSIEANGMEILAHGVPADLFGPLGVQPFVHGELRFAKSIEVSLTGGPSTICLVVDKTTERMFWRRLAVAWRLFWYDLKDEDDEEADS